MLEIYRDVNKWSLCWTPYAHDTLAGNSCWNPAPLLDSSAAFRRELQQNLH